MPRSPAPANFLGLARWTTPQSTVHGLSPSRNRLAPHSALLSHPTHPCIPTAVSIARPRSQQFCSGLFTVAHVHSRSPCNHRPPSSAIAPLRRLRAPDKHTIPLAYCSIHMSTSHHDPRLPTRLHPPDVISAHRLPWSPIRVTHSPFVQPTINSAYSCNQIPCASIMILCIIEPISFASCVLDRVISSIVRSYSGMHNATSHPTPVRLMDPPSLLPTPVPPPLRPTLTPSGLTYPRSVSPIEPRLRASGERASGKVTFYR